jgi:diketogulonate reductase-like aldo/keto reductase
MEYTKLGRSGLTPQTLTLNNGLAMPALGFGAMTAPEVTADVVATAIRAGYRLIDTAAGYRNEEQVGQGLRDSGIDRDELFITTKLWLDDYGYDSTLRGFDASASQLGLEQVDLYLLHWPVPSAIEATIASYHAAERLLADGRVHAIGVCNHKPEHLVKLAAATTIPPAVNQVELNPFFAQPDVRAADANYGTTTQCWSPLGGINVYRPADPDAVRNPLEHPTITDIARAYGKTPAQVVLRWHLVHGLSPIPRSTNPERIAENFDVFDFTLTETEVAAIDALDWGVRGGPDPDTILLDPFKH